MPAVSAPFPVIVLGLISGMSYGILAVGLVLIYRSNRIVNFAHGEVGAFAAAVFGLWVAKFGLPYWLIFPVVLLLAAGVSMVIEVAAIRRLRDAPAVMSIVATLGAGAFLLVLSLTVNSQIRRGVDYPQPTGVPEFNIGALLVTPSYSAMLLVTPFVVLAIALFLAKTRFGIAIRAAAGNPDAAKMAGISTSRMSSLAWGIAGAVSAYTAILQFPQKGFVLAGQSLGPGLLTRALVAAVVARMTSLPVALVAGLGVGVIEQVMLWNSPSGGLVEVILFGLILAALLVQTRRGGRQDEQGSWLAVQTWQPLPEQLHRVWAIRNLGRVVAGATVGLLVLVALTTSEASLVFTTVVAFTLVGFSVYVTTGLGGELSLGQFAAAGVGAAAAYHLARHGASFPIVLLGAGVAAAAASVVVGLPALRIRGLMLAVATLAFAVMAEAWLFQQPWMFGGGAGTGKPAFGPFAADTARRYYLVTLPVLGIGLWLTWNVRRSGLGRALVALRDNEEGARAFTLPVAALRLQSFALSGFLAGLGGAVFAFALGRINAQTFPAQASITVVAMSAIGGLSLLSGPLIGALYLIAFPQFVPLDSAGLAASTLGWLILILYFPGGLAQLVEPVRNRVIRILARRAGIDLASLEPAEGGADEAADVELDVAGPSYADGRLARLIATDGRRRVNPQDDVLAVRELSRSFGGVRAVDGVTLQVRRGETLGIIGPNGAGKTTLFELIGGFTRPDTGRVVFDHIDVTRYPPEERAELGLVRSFQNPRLFETMTVLESIQLAHERLVPTRFLPSVLGLPSAATGDRLKERRAREVAEVMGLSRYRNTRINQLSTGTRRIAELACIVTLDPKVLLLDEPSSGIAQRETEALGDLLIRLKEVLDASYVVIEHDMPLIMGISDRLVAMEAGRVLAEGAPAEIRRHPLVIESYLGGDVRAIERSGPHVTASAAEEPIAAET